MLPVLLAILAAEPADVSEAVYRRKVVAPDGAALALYRYVPPGGGRSKRPVLLLPEVGFGREAYDDGDGMARWFHAAGREVYVAELRGQGRAASPKGWRPTDWVRFDLPAVLSALRRERPGPVDVVAHGYAGTLALAASTAELRGQVGAVVALCTPVMPEVPNPLVERWLTASGRLEPRGAFEKVFGRNARFGRGRLDALERSASPLSPEAAGELLGWMRQGDLKLHDGSTVRGRLQAYDRPTLLFLALGNDFAHPEFASPLRELGPRVQLKVLSRVELLAEDYTHLSLLHGQGAKDDVFAPALAFLEGPAAVDGDAGR